MENINNLKLEGYSKLAFKILTRINIEVYMLIKQSERVLQLRQE